MVLRLNGALIEAKVLIKLTIESGESPHRARLNAKFAVFNSTSSYDAIMGQPQSHRVHIPLWHILETSLFPLTSFTP